MNNNYGLRNNEIVELRDVCFGMSIFIFRSLLFIINKKKNVSKTVSGAIIPFEIGNARVKLEFNGAQLVTDFIETFTRCQM